MKGSAVLCDAGSTWAKYLPCRSYGYGGGGGGSAAAVVGCGCGSG